MQCPVCENVALVMSDRQGIEIDYCPKCRGVWLDRGELDKIIERSTPEPAARPAPEFRSERPPRQENDERYRQDERYRDDERHRHGKRRGFLGDLFDFD